MQTFFVKYGHKEQLSLQNSCK